VHAANATRQRDWPDTMLLTSTHDTKRSEDVRARLAVLSEVPERWATTVERWFERHASQREAAGPSRNLEYLLYQTLVGAWPIGAERVLGYLQKAAREEKRHTDWHRPARAYERATAAFATRLLADPGFTDEVASFVDSIRDAGWVNSLVQTTLKLTSPGVPDLYQGCELWDLSLVDPDSRRDVDFDRRRTLLAEVVSAGVATIWERRDEGLPKLAVSRALLRLRRDHPERFGAGATYEPLTPAGPRSDHVFAFSRSGTVAVVVPRLTVALGDRFGSWDWGATSVALPPGPWDDVLTGARHPGGGSDVADLLRDLPICVLSRADV
jgi:(1->4)-alpha-D-glucan 1-alpha-D-glucosylmutase